MWVAVNALSPPPPPLCSGIFGERLPLRYYLSGGMVLSGVFTSLFGLAYFWEIHVLWYYVIIQVRSPWPSFTVCSEMLR